MTESGKIGDVGDETQILKITDENRPPISNVHIVHHAYHNNNQPIHDNDKCLTFFPSMGHFREKNSFPKSNHWSRRRSVQYSVYSVVRAGQVLETIALTTAACNLHGQQTTSPFMVLIIVSEARSHFGITASAVLKYLTYEKGSKVEQTCLNFDSKTA